LIPVNIVALAARRSEGSNQLAPDGVPMLEAAAGPVSMALNRTGMPSYSSHGDLLKTAGERAEPGSTKGAPVSEYPRGVGLHCDTTHRVLQSIAVNAWEPGAHVIT
jgi:hypothetical protein